MIVRWLIERFTGHTHAWRYEAPQVTGPGRVYGPWIHCPTCGAVRAALDEPPANHPESMAPLPPKQEKQLAALEALLAKEAA
jgi:hypothetical protein